MDEHTGSLSTLNPDSENKRVPNPKEILERLTDVRTDQFKFPETKALACVVGMDPQHQLCQSGWTYFLLPEQNADRSMVFETVDQQILDLSQCDKPVPIDDIKTVTIGGQKYSLDRDAWGNPCVYLYDDSRSELEPQIKESFDKVIQVWESALAGEDVLRASVVSILGGDVMSNIDRILDQLERYPELQDNESWASEIDLWGIAQKGKTVAGALEILRGENGGIKLPYEFDQTSAFRKCEELVTKLVSRQPLTEDDRQFINAAAYANISTSRSIRDFTGLRITDLTRRFAIANIAENFLCREVVGWDIYQSHQQDYRDFIQKMKSQGYEVPDWFSPYKGNEFVWGIALDGSIANAAGKYFVDFYFTQSYATHVLNHERIHNRNTLALELGGRRAWEEEERSGERMPWEHYHESVTETLALLVRNRGDVSAAARENLMSSIMYRSGVDEMLNILNEIETHTSQPLFGSQLLLDGFKQLAEGKTRQLTSMVQDFYDREIAGEVGAFDQRMSRFQDNNMIRVSWDSNSEPPVFSFDHVQEIANVVIDELKYEDLTEKEKSVYWDKQVLEHKRDWERDLVKEYPGDILGLTPSPIRNRIRNVVLQDESARQEMNALIEHKYKKYLAALKTYQQTGKRQKIR